MDVKRHFVLDSALYPPYPESTEQAVFGMGCFWQVEHTFWVLDGVYSTVVGYAGGATPDPSYREVCTDRTGHAEVVRVVFYPEIIAYGALLEIFWRSHDPAQGMRQGNDVGTQYRSVIYTHGESQLTLALASRDAWQAKLAKAGRGRITTGIEPAPTFYYAEGYHQQYLARNRYCPASDF